MKMNRNVVAQAFQSRIAGFRDIPVACWRDDGKGWAARIGDWKVPKTRRQECLRYAVLGNRSVASTLAPRGASGERAGEMGILTNVPPLPALSSALRKRGRKIALCVSA